MLCALPIATWELSVGVWMTVKGFRVAPGANDPALAVAAPSLQGATV